MLMSYCVNYVRPPPVPHTAVQSTINQNHLNREKESGALKEIRHTVLSLSPPLSYFIICYCCARNFYKCDCCRSLMSAARLLAPLKAELSKECTFTNRAVNQQRPWTEVLTFCRCQLFICRQAECVAACFFWFFFPLDTVCLLVYPHLCL